MCASAPAHANSYFMGIGYEPFVPGTNSSDYALSCSVSTVDIGGAPQSAAELYLMSSWRAEVQANGPSTDHDAEGRRSASAAQVLAPYASTFCVQFSALFRVQWLYKVRVDGLWLLRHVAISARTPNSDCCRTYIVRYRSVTPRR